MNFKLFSFTTLIKYKPLTKPLKSIVSEASQFCFENTISLKLFLTIMFLLKICTKVIDEIAGLG